MVSLFDRLCDLIVGGESYGGERVCCRLVSKSLEKTARKWVTATNDFQCCAGPSIKLFFWVLFFVPWCLIAMAGGFVVNCYVWQRSPAGLEWLRSTGSGGKRAAPLEPLSSFCLDSNIWSPVMSFARRQLKSSWRHLLPAVRSDSVCECSVLHLWL